MGLKEDADRLFAVANETTTDVVANPSDSSLASWTLKRTLARRPRPN